MDVSGSTTVTNVCKSTANSCTFNSTNGAYSPNNGLTESTTGVTYPLSGTPYYTNPCNGIYKKIDLQVTCGACGITDGGF